MNATTPPHMLNMDPLALHDDVLPQIEALSLVRGRPLVVTDCDEVLMQFLVGLELYLETQGLWLDLKSYALTGNIKRRETNEAIDPSQMPELMKGFFATSTHSLLAVPGAADALKALSSRAQVVVLTNVPFSEKETRAKSLTAQGMDYPVIANKGLKGGAVRRLADMVDAPVFFLDDIPHNIASVAKAHDACHLLHFIADKRLAKLMGQAPDSHFHTTEWQEAHDFIASRLDAAGF
ncbi:MAG: hypothetical protein K8R18_04890 [Parvibaculum sp.]|uniref:hypothetical protein n=1 Tax=Parvibaculum sp. TaxID=2024848 RepID=UPI0025F93F4B|nr:hypothetical protein [Parvibaculum sp.]MCE9648946.1 hypothetical protein [Parvibaculum sp.]